MTKWDYIRMISKCGSRYGSSGGVLDLLEWCEKSNTNQVTLNEAKEFWEMRSRCKENALKPAAAFAK